MTSVSQVGDRIEDRLLRQARRKGLPAGSFDKRELFGTYGAVEGGGGHDAKMEATVRWAYPRITRTRQPLKLALLLNSASCRKE
jgi:hypothetical protein